MKRMFVITACCALFLLGATSNQPTVVLTELSRHAIPAPLIEGSIQAISGAELLPNQHIVFMEAMGGSLIDWDRAAGAFHVIPDEGQLGAPWALDGNGDGVVVLSVGPPELIFLDAAFQVERRQSLSKTVFNPKAFAVLEDGTAIVSGGLNREHGEYHFFDAQGDLRASLMARFHRSAHFQVRRHISGGAFHFDRVRDRMVVSLAAPHMIGVLEALERGDTPWAADSVMVPAVDDTFMRTSEEGGQRRFTYDWNFRRSAALLPLAGGEALLNVVTDVSKDLTIWEVYSASSGKKTGQTQTPGALFPLVAWGDTIVAAANQWTPQTQVVVLEVGIKR